MQINQNIKHKFFDKPNIHTHTLCVYLSETEVSLAIIDDKKLVTLLKSYSLKYAQSIESFISELSQFFKEEELFKNSYKSVKISYHSKGYCLVPQVYFDENASVSYFELHNPTTFNCLVFNDYIEAFNLYLIYGVPKAIFDVLQKTFDSFEFQHGCSFLLNYLSKNSESANLVHVNIRRNEMDILILNNNGNLQLLSTYNYATTDEFIYFILNALQKNNLEFASTKVIVFGDILIDSKEYIALLGFVPNLKLAYRPTNLSYCTELSVLPTSYHQNLLGMY